jgi:hypothetical protein
MKLVFCLGMGALVASIVAACGGASFSALTTGDDGDGGGVAADGGIDSEGLGAEGGSKSDSGPNKPEAGGAADSSSGGVDAADTGPPITHVKCGSIACAEPQFCCIYSTAVPGSFDSQCNSSASCPSKVGDTLTATLACSAAGNCSIGDVCCITKDGTSGAVTSKCMSPSACRNSGSGGTTAAFLCNPLAGANECPSSAGPCENNNINAWGLPDSYGTCGGEHP